MPDEAFPIARPVALVGLMGSGKTTIGRLLAARLGIGFIDTDEAIASSTNMSVACIFEKLGEAHFRKLEQDLVEKLRLSEPLVVATGGGLFADPLLRRRLLETCLTVWLDAPVEQLLERLSRSGDRPLLKGQDPHMVLDRLAETRREAYASAHVRIEGHGGGPETAVEAILTALRNHRADPTR